MGVEDSVDALRLQGVGEHLTDQQLGIVLLLLLFGGQAGDEQSFTSRPQAHLVRQIGVLKRGVEVGCRQIAEAEPTQHGLPALPTVAQHQQLVPVPEDSGPQALPLPVPSSDIGHQQGVRPLHPLEGQVPGVEQGLVLGVAEVQAVLIDEVLDHRVDEGGDVPVHVHVLPDTGRADVLQVGGQLELDHFSGDAQLLSLRQGGLARPAEDDVVHGVDRPVHRGGLIGAGVAHHIAAHHQIDLLAGEELPQAAQVPGVGQVHRDIVGKQVDVEVPGDGQVDDLPADHVGLGLFGPGELVHRQIHLEAHLPNGVGDALVGQGEGVKGAGEKGDLPGLGEGEGPLAYLADMW